MNYQVGFHGCNLILPDRIAATLYIHLKPLIRHYQKVLPEPAWSEENNGVYFDLASPHGELLLHGLQGEGYVEATPRGVRDAKPCLTGLF